MPPVKSRPASAGPLIRTARLVLRPFRQDDLAPLVRLLEELDDRSLFDSGGRPLSPARLAAVLVRESTARPGGGSRPLNLAVLLKGHRRPFGGARVCRDSEGVAEIGLWLSRETRGRGLGREALQALLRLAFDPLGCRRVHGTCDAENAASRKLMESVGMQPQCTFATEDRRGKPLHRMTYSLENGHPTSR
jgi:8-oxo-dGTP diphosphatase